LYQKLIQISAFSNISWTKKLSQKLYFLQIYDDNNGRTFVWYLPFSWLKKPWGRKIFSASRNVFQKDIPVNFLAQKFMTNYGIFSTYSVTFISQKILTCPQCRGIVIRVFALIVTFTFVNG